MPSSRPAIRFADILANIDAIGRHIGDRDEAAFLADELRVDAVERCLSRLSEAASKLGALAEQLEPGILWRDIRDFGNFLRHQYDEVVRLDLWAIIQRDLPPLREAAERGMSKLACTDPKD